MPTVVRLVKITSARELACFVKAQELVPGRIGASLVAFLHDSQQRWHLFARDAGFEVWNVCNSRSGRFLRLPEIEDDTLGQLMANGRLFGMNS